jgi:hypothetical protein
MRKTNPMFAGETEGCDMMRERKDGPPVALENTLERRTVLDWLGKGAVLAIGAGLFSAGACGGDTGAEVKNGKSDGGSRDAGCTPDSFPFAPGEALQAVYRNWGERTVDKQDLKKILAEWKLTVDGLVESPATLPFPDLMRLTRRDQVTDFHCVEGWSVYDVPWNGVHLSTIFDIVKPMASATHVIFTCVGDVYRESLPLEVALEPRSMLGYGIDCNTLPLAHGFPLRMVVPRKFGYKNPKYVYRIQLAESPITGYWSQFGYAPEGDVPKSRLRAGKY